MEAMSRYVLPQQVMEERSESCMSAGIILVDSEYLLIENGGSTGKI
jgi:hypothetical protein